MTHWLASTALVAAGLFVAQPGLAAGDATQVASFPDAVQSYLVKHHGRLFSLNENTDGSISVYAANRPGAIWNAVPEDAVQLNGFTTATAEIDQIGIYKQHVYVGTENTDGAAELWRMCVWCRPAQWEQVGGDDLDSATEIVDMFKVEGIFYVLTAEASGNALYMSEDGDNWTPVGTAGLGNSITDAVGVSKQTYAGIHYVYIATATGSVYRADVTDLTTWTLATTLDGTVTAIFGINVAVSTDGIAYSYHTEDGLTYIMGSEAGLGNTNNSEVTRYSRVRNGVYAVLSNSVDGVEIRKWNDETSLWELVGEPGFGDADNSAVTTLMKYRGYRYASTVNSVDGPSVYKLDKDADGTDGTEE